MCWQVMSVKALGIALKLTFSGMNQLIYPQTWLFTVVVVACILTQMNYLNKVIILSVGDFFNRLLSDHASVSAKFLKTHRFLHVPLRIGMKWYTNVFNMP
jgi:hypothetical protein